MTPNFVIAKLRTRAAIGVGLSLLIHATILFLALDRTPSPMLETGALENERLTVNLLPPVPPTPATKQTALASVAPAPLSSLPRRDGLPATVPANKETQRTKPLTHKPPKTRANELARVKQASKTAARMTPPPTSTATARLAAGPPNSASASSAASSSASPTTALPADMSDMLAAARERRRAAGIGESESSVGERASPDDNAIARANIAEMMQKQSRGRNKSGGVFQITFKGVRSGEFIFHGWDLRRRTNARQLILVDAPDGDIDTAIVRRMIELIRRYEKGDFPWNSARLGRVVMLSARVEDSAELEAFLKREDF